MHTFFVKILIISIVSQICWGHGVKPHTPKQIPNDRRKKFGSMLFTSPNPKNFLHHEINFCFYDLISSLRMNCISTYFDNILATKRYMLVPTCLRRHVMSTSQLNRQMAWNLFGKSCLDVPHLRHMASFWQKWNCSLVTLLLQGVKPTEFRASFVLTQYLCQSGHSYPEVQPFSMVMPSHAMSCRLWVADPSDQWWAGCTPTHPDAVLHWNSSLALRIQSRHRSSLVPGHARSRRSCHSWS